MALASLCRPSLPGSERPNSCIQVSVPSNSGPEPRCRRDPALGHPPPPPKKKGCAPALTAGDPGEFRAFLPPRHRACGCRGVAPPGCPAPPLPIGARRTPPCGSQSPAALQLHPHPHLGCHPRPGPAPRWGSPGSALLRRAAANPSFRPARFLSSQTRSLHPQPPLPADLPAPRGSEVQTPFPLGPRTKGRPLAPLPPDLLIRT